MKYGIRKATIISVNINWTLPMHEVTPKMLNFIIAAVSLIYNGKAIFI